MKHSQFSKKRLAVYISAALTASVTTSTMAEEAVLSESKEDKVEVIEVRGIKGSLTRAMNLKRDMSGVVDAISSEEMGKFPDSNLAESLQRITGVAVSRSNGEGSQITVRGFGPEFNLVTLNGRQMPGTGNTRSYNFENLASDGVSALEVFKTARAENPTGGLGATVNIVTGKPLSNPGEKLSISAKALYDSSNVEGNDITPELSALYSNTFADESLGFAVSISHQRRDFQQQSANIQGWQANVDLPTLDESKVIDNRDAEHENVFFPRDMNYSISDVERERTNGYVVFQYAPTDNLILTLDYTASNTIAGTNSIGWGMWNDYGGNINAYELDENGTAVYTDISGNDGSFSAIRSTNEVEAESIGFNIDWIATDTLYFTVDYHNSSNKTDNGKDSGLGSEGTLVLGSDQLDTKIYDFRTGEIPQAEILWNNGSNVLATSEIDSHFSQFIHSPGESEIEQLQIDGVWENDAFDIPLIDIKFGIARTEQKMSGSNAWSGLIGGFGFGTDYTAILPDGMFTAQNTNGFLDAFDGGGNDLSTNYYYTFDFDELVTRSEAFLTNGELGGDDYFATTAYHDKGTYSEASVQEDTTSLYVQAGFEFEIADFPVQLNVGLRYEQTDVTSTVFQDVPTGVWWQGGSEWHTQYQDSSYYQATGEHDVFLPMLDIKVDLTNELVGRISWGKSISRAPLGDLAGGLSLSSSPKIGSRNGSEGNTNLQPYESTNLDISFEYYYGDASYASIGYFRKEVKNFISTESYSATYDGIYDVYLSPRWQQAVADLEANGEQTTNDAIFAQIQANGSALNAEGYLTPTSSDPLIEWDISRPFNSDETKVAEGLELAAQHLFGDSGFGLGANATLVEGDVEYDVEDLTGVQSPLTGLGHSANFQAFYEKDGLSVKVTYAWRDEYLIGVGQDQGSADNPPQYAKAFGQLDMSVNYDVNDSLTVFFEGLNLNDETEQAFGRYEEQFLFARQYGPRYTLGARYSF